MSLSVNSPSPTRLKALASLVNEGETIKYAASMYSVPLAVAQEYIAGLSARTPANTLEKYMAEDAKAVEAHLTHGRGVSATKGHMTIQGGIRGHSAGDIFPYIIVLKGNFVDGFEYLLTGNGIEKVGRPYDTYDHAHREALGWLEFESLDAMILNI